MRVKFWGVRGSIPSAEPTSMGVGGNTSCVEIILPESDIIILDAGTGIRRLGNHLLKEKRHEHQKIHILLSHTHWDHIQGLPFFKPSAIASNQIYIYGANKPDKTLEEVVRGQMSFEYFPVSMEQLGATFHFVPVDEVIFKPIPGIMVMAGSFNHPGGVYGYRIQWQDKVFVYATDMEYTPENLPDSLVEFCRGADLLIFDSQYTGEEYKTKAGWGHSSHECAATLAIKAEVKQLRLFSHDPDHTDQELEKMEQEAQAIFPATALAREGESVDLGS